MKLLKNSSGETRIWVMGAAFGFLIAVASVYWAVNFSQKSVLEKDISHTLGLAEESTPAVALRPLNSEELAQALGFENVDVWSSSAALFAERIQAGFVSQEWRDECTEKQAPTLCWVIEDYFQNQAEIFGVSRNRNRKKWPLLSPQNMVELQKEEFAAILGKLPDWDQRKMIQFSEAALKTESCPQNFSLALARKWEVHLNREEFKQSVWGWIRKLEKKGLDCLELSDSGAEFGFFRAGIWDFLEKDFASAKQKFEKALSVQNPKEEYRVRYWYHRTLLELGEKTEVQKQSRILKDKFPISFHTLITKAQEGEDPFKIFKDAAYYSDQRDSRNPDIQKRLLWLLSILENENASFAVKRYGEFFIKSLGEHMEAPLMQFLARQFDRMAYHRLQIMALNQIVVKKPTQVNLETLRLLFPRPFLEQLETLSPHLDLAVVLGLARQESGFDPGATSGVNARGLLQVLPSTARGVKKKIQADDLYDYQKNIQVGGQYLLNLIRLFEGSLEKSLAAYNAGQGTLKKWQSRYGFIEDPLLFMDSMPYRETRDYVPSILRNAYWYHRLFPELRKGFQERTVITSEILKDLIEKSETHQLSN